jgi:hypothetical protein
MGYGGDEGKSTLAASLQALLQGSPYDLNVAVVSLDGESPLPSYCLNSSRLLTLLR